MPLPQPGEGMVGLLALHHSSSSSSLGEDIDWKYEANDVEQGSVTRSIGHDRQNIRFDIQRQSIVNAWPKLKKTRQTTASVAVPCEDYGVLC